MSSIWTEQDFDSLNWHDVYVHGFQVLEGEHGAGEIWFDLDYILEWICPSAPDSSACRFRIAPATLKFREVTSLRLSLDYATVSAGMGPFSIDGIQREEISYGPGHRSFRWEIAVSWPQGAISLESPGFSQRLTGAPIESTAQHLTQKEREG